MIYEFKSRVTGTLVTTQDVAERILRIVGKPNERKGVILPEQIPAAIASLENAVARERQAQMQAGQTGAADPRQLEEEDNDDQPATVSLAQRVFPFLDMLRTAQAAGKEITWGV